MKRKRAVSPKTSVRAPRAARRRKAPSARYTVVFRPDPEGGYQVFVPAFPEICTYGRTMREARAMARDAILCAVEANLKDGVPVPSEARAQPPIEVVEVSFAKA